MTTKGQNKCHLERSEGPAVDPALEPASTAMRVPHIWLLRCGISPLHAIHTFYKQLVAPILRGSAAALGLQTSCRFQPTCSDYAALALAQHGPLRGLSLAIMRLLRCHPFSRGGWDPVPPSTAPSQPASPEKVP